MDNFHNFQKLPINIQIYIISLNRETLLRSITLSKQYYEQIKPLLYEFDILPKEFNTYLIECMPEVFTISFTVYNCAIVCVGTLVNKLKKVWSIKIFVYYHTENNGEFSSTLEMLTTNNDKYGFYGFFGYPIRNPLQSGFLLTADDIIHCIFNNPNCVVKTFTYDYKTKVNIAMRRHANIRQILNNKQKLLNLIEIHRRKQISWTERSTHKYLEFLYVFIPFIYIFDLQDLQDLQDLENLSITVKIIKYSKEKIIKYTTKPNELYNTRIKNLIESCNDLIPKVISCIENLKIE